MTNLIYIANIRFPTEKAHGLQIAQMCQAFSKKKLLTTLVVPNRKPHSHLLTTPQKLYSLSIKLTTKKLPCIDLLQYLKASDPTYLKEVSFFLQSLSFSISSLLFLLGTPSKQLVYSRHLFALLPSLFLNKNFFIELHRFPQTWIGKWFHKLAFSRIQGAVFISKTLRNLYLKADIVPKRHLVAHDATTPITSITKSSKTESRKITKLPLNKRIILYTGSLFSWKGVFNLLEASQYLPKNHLTIFIGGSSIEPSTKKFTTKATSPEYQNILLLKHVSRSKLQPYLSTADVLVLPTTTDSPHAFYNSPLKLFDYMIANRPIVATSLPSVKEVLDENCAMLVKPDSSRSLANGIISLINNPKLSRKLANKAQLIAKDHTWEKRADSINNFINE